MTRPDDIEARRVDPPRGPTDDAAVVVPEGDPANATGARPEMVVLPDAADLPTTGPEAATLRAADRDAAATNPAQGLTPGGPPAAAVPAHRADPQLRRRLAPWVIVASGVIVLGSAAIGLSYTPLFEARSILVTGEQHLSESKVLKIAHLSTSTNLLHTDLGTAERRLERNPWVRAAVVSRRLPGTLNVQLTERDPVAVVGVRSTLRIVASDGTDLGAASETSGLPKIQILGSTETPTGDALAAGSVVAAALPQSLRPAVSTISVGSEGAVLIVLHSGITVTFGDEGEAIAKGEALSAVLNYAADQGVHLAAVDVTVPETPSATLVGGSSITPAR